MVKACDVDARTLDVCTVDDGDDCTVEVRELETWATDACELALELCELDTRELAIEEELEDRLLEEETEPLAPLIPATKPVVPLFETRVCGARFK